MKKNGIEWIEQIFKAGKVNEGSVVWRGIDVVAKHASADELVTAVNKRGFHLAVVGTEYVIICNMKGSINVIR